MTRLLVLVLVVSWMSIGCGSPAPVPYGPSEAHIPPPARVPPTSWNERPAASDALVVLTDPGRLPELRVRGAEGDKLPLERTEVNAHLYGFVGEVEVAQTFANPHSKPIEVVYVFPLPENSAVGAMHMKIGERIIRAKIEERGQARRMYKRAKRQGKTAALLEQERPNVFTQSVANIAPGESIDVVIRYVQDLTYDDGRYEFVFPMVVGPRFIPGTPLDAAMRGEGTYLDTDRVPDASRITPPVLGKGERSGHDITVEVTVENALPVNSYSVPTHQVAAHQPADGSLNLRLVEEESIPNRDFVLRYEVAGKEPRATLLTSGEDQNGYFALMVHPPALDVNELVGKRELVFVVDVSGSMSGVPLGMCKTAIRAALGKLRPWDTFNIMTFAGATRKLFGSARPANRTNVEKALSFLMAARAGGGTHLDDAVRTVLQPDVGQGRHRYVFFLTDGYVGNEREIVTGSKELVEGLEARGQRARVFAFGVGSSTNRALLEGLSRAGNGVAVYATNREDPARAVNQFYRYIDRSVLTDLRLSWGELGAAETFPNPIPDLFASHPVIVHGRYKRLGDGPVVLHARLGEEAMQLDVEVRETLSTGKRGGVLGRLWARSKVQFLEEEGWIGMRPDAPKRITELGLDYELVTPYTSFIAIDESRIVGDGNPTKIVQPVEIPEGVDGDMAGARTRRPLTNFSQHPNRQPIAPGLIPADPSPEPLEEGDDDDDDDASGADAPPPMEPALQPSPTEPYEVQGGRCHCRAAGTPSRGAWPTALALFGLLLIIGRRRRP